MDRVVFLVDGFNLYHSLKAKPQYLKYRWSDLRRLCDMFVKHKSQVIEGVFYFTALAFWDQGKMRRHKLYINALRLSGVEIVYGEFKIRDKRCRKCHQMFRSPDEKMTDVNIAINLLKLALLDRYDTAIVVSADSDLVPSVEATKQLFPSKQVGVLFPINRALITLKNATDFHYRIKEKHLTSSLFPETITTSAGQKLECPPE
jgi:uncharacterized LabA/DUF88 family protein